MIATKFAGFLRFGLLCAMLLVAGGLVATAQAAQHVFWNQAAFASAQNAGKSIIVYVTAPWCTICAKQKPTIQALENDPKFAQAIVFEVDFDSQKRVLRQMHVSMQSTLIAFKGEAETARATGITDAAEIRALFERSL
jgi:thiol-disulfide isomerase/thioredoxin